MKELDTGGLDGYVLANLPPLISLERLQSRIVEQRIEAAIQRVKTTSKAHYDSISVLSTYWEADETGGVLDANLFLQTISQLHDEDTRVTTDVHVLPDNAKVYHLISKINSLVEALTGARRLFIFHYPGHGASDRNTNNLIISSKISKGKRINGSHLNMTLIKDTLRDLASTCVGLDVLILLDCFPASLGRRSKTSIGRRVELMAATSAGGLSNSREGEETFTIYWCRSFDKLMKVGEPFDCDAIMSSINEELGLEQPATFVLRGGCGAPITFRAPLLSTTLAPTPQHSRTVITALHIAEDAHSESLNHLIEYLQRGAPADFRITILAALPIASTLLLLRVPVYFQEMLELPRVSFAI
jgi:hypothetical protein